MYYDPFSNVSSPSINAIRASNFSTSVCSASSSSLSDKLMLGVHGGSPFNCSSYIKVSSLGKTACFLIKNLYWAGSSNFPSRSEEHTSELQSRFELVCRLLLE